MPGNTDGRWYQMAEAGSAWGLSFLYWSYRVLGRAPLRIMLWPVLAYFFVFKPGQRRASLEYLRKVYAAGGLKQKPGLLTPLRHFYSFAEAIVDKVIAFNGGFKLSDVVSQGREPIEAQLKKGRGVMLISAHIGNLEVCRVLSHEQQDLKLQVLVHTRHAENFNRLIRRLNPGMNVNLHQVSELGVGQAAWLSDRLAKGESLVIAGDRSSVSGNRTVSVPFLGEEAHFAQGPWVLASLMECPVFLIFCLRVQGRYHIYYEPFEERVSLPRGSREAAVQALVQRYAKRLEHYCLLSPYEWFNFFPFWRKHD